MANKDIIKLLLEYAVNPNIGIWGDNRTVLYCNNISSEIMKLFLEYRCNPNNQISSHRKTPLHFYSDREHSRGGDCDKKMKLLLEYRSNSNLETKFNKQTALSFYMDINHSNLNVSTIKMLLDYEANSSIPDRWGSTPLHKACSVRVRGQGSKKEIVKLLIISFLPFKKMRTFLLRLKRNQKQTNLKIPKFVLFIIVDFFGEESVKNIREFRLKQNKYGRTAQMYLEEMKNSEVFDSELFNFLEQLDRVLDDEFNSLLQFLRT